MHHRIIYTYLTFALVAALTSAAMAQGAGTGGSLSVPDQIGGGTTGNGTTFQIETGPAPIAPDEKTRIDQPEGQDLCDPSVPDSARRAAGVDCERGIPVDAGEARPALAKDPLLTPRDETLKGDFDDLNLGDDVPATVILQQ